MNRRRTSELPRAQARTARRQACPNGAIAGLLLVASACVGVSMALYHVAGPRDVFADELASPADR